jgi:hypothetical protein
MRQDDSTFSSLLAAVRMGQLPLEIGLLSQPQDVMDSFPRLVMSKREALAINQRQLANQPGSSTEYRATDRSDPETSFAEWPVEKVLELKVGVPCMLLADLSKRHRKGMIGKVLSLSTDHACVEFSSGPWNIFPYHFIHRVHKDVCASRIQIPLVLAFALVLYRVQSHALQKGSLCFDFNRNVLNEDNNSNSRRRPIPGSVYVALSRFPTLRSVKVIGNINPQACPIAMSFWNGMSASGCVVPFPSLFLSICVSEEGALSV